MVLVDLLFVSTMAMVQPSLATERCSVSFIPPSLTVELGSEATFRIQPCNPYPGERHVQLILENKNVVRLNCSSVTIGANSIDTVPVLAKAIGVQSEFFIEANDSAFPHPEDYGLRVPFMLITVVHYRSLEIFIQFCGWLYFIAWSVSFYPQMFLNWRRKSVVGLNFDFLAFNFTGFLFYSIFNCAFFFIPLVQRQYFQAIPHGVNPVQINDVVFAIHALFSTIVTIAQCFFYDRGDQRISITCSVLLAIGWLFALISMILACASVLTWLLFVWFLSYIKLIITLIKYIPQAYLNFRRKSTIGWSIGNVLLDFTGGTMSMLQMILLAYNHDDWQQIFGDFTKFGLGFISLCFDILFILQHYVFYRFSNYESAGSPSCTSIAQLVHN